MKRVILILVASLSVTFYSCNNDDDNTANTTNPPVNNTEQREYKIQLWGIGTSEPQAPLEIMYYSDTQGGALIPHTVNSQTNQDIVEMYILSSYNKVGFKFDADDNGEAYINTVVITDVEANEVIFENNTLDIDDNETFLYNISEETHSIE